jgi:hypothetical protein
MVRGVAAARIGSGSLDEVRYELRTGGLRVRRLRGRPPFGPGTDADVVSRREVAVSGLALPWQAPPDVTELAAALGNRLDAARAIAAPR